MLEQRPHDLQDDALLFQIERWRLAKQWERSSWEGHRKRTLTFHNTYLKERKHTGMSTQY